MTKKELINSLDERKRGKKSVNKTELIGQIAAKSPGKSKKQAGEELNEVLDTITEFLREGQEVKILEFGTFKITEVKAKTVRNPQNKEQMEVPAYNRLRFIPSKKLKEAVNS